MNLLPISLLVEDDAAHVLLFQHAYKKANLNYPLFVVRDGEAAIAYLTGIDGYSDRDQYPLPAFIWLDLKLPRFSGFEVLEWLKYQPALQHLSVIILTSSEDERDMEKATALGAIAYLMKPVTPANLMRYISI